MIISSEEKPSILEKSEDFESMSFGIQEEDISHIIILLRQKLYANPIDAICRELSCNCRDANREVGLGNKPIKIQIRENIFLNGNTCIEFCDDGPGISPDRMKDVFINYGASTKRNTNGQTGGFGLGAKTPFAYASTFIIETTNGGYKYTYLASVNDANRGNMTLLNKEDAFGEDTGTTVAIPLKEEDIKSFVNGCLRATATWEVTPTFKSPGNTTWEESYNRGLDYQCAIYTKYRVIKGSFSFNTRGGCVGALVDGVPYPIPDSFLSENSIGFINQHSKDTIYLEIETGEVSLTPSREDLHYDDRTVRFLKNAFNNMKEDISKRAKKIEKKLESPWKWYAVLYGLEGIDGVSESKLFEYHNILRLSLSINNRSTFLEEEYDNILNEVAIISCSFSGGSMYKGSSSRLSKLFTPNINIIVQDFNLTNASRNECIRIEDGDKNNYLIHIPERRKTLSKANTSKTEKVVRLLDYLGLPYRLYSSYKKIKGTPKERVAKHFPCRLKTANSYNLKKGSIEVTEDSIIFYEDNFTARKLDPKECAISFVVSIRDSWNVSSTRYCPESLQYLNLIGVPECDQKVIIVNENREKALGIIKDKVSLFGRPKKLNKYQTRTVAGFYLENYFKDNHIVSLAKEMDNPIPDLRSICSKIEAEKVKYKAKKNVDKGYEKLVQLIPGLKEATEDIEGDIRSFVDSYPLVKEITDKNYETLKEELFIYLRAKSSLKGKD